jgi:uncharacterized membrane protein YozB (DUF420 family)
MAAAISQTINLFIQVLMLGMLVAAYLLFRRKRFIMHARLMTVAFGMNIISFILVMVPSLTANGGNFLVEPIMTFNVVSIVHIPIGIAAMLLSAFLIVRWASNSYKVGGCRGKWLMRATLLTWATSILIGISIYVSMPS